jgi:hypothetical protein
MKAHTNFDPSFPGYINVEKLDDGTVRVVVRGDPKTREGIHVCGFAADKGKHGRCTPGDDRCNNYCNMAPEKGPMAPSALPATITDCGETVMLTLPWAAWDDVRTEGGVAAETVNECELPEVAMARYIEQLRAAEGDSFTICCDNPEAVEPETRVAVDVCGYWTDWNERRFIGESVLQCLAKAVGALEDFKANLAKGKA